MFFGNKIQSVKIGQQKFNYCGNIELLQQNCISVCGTRTPSPQSEKWLKNIVNQCKTPVISGLALGSDAIAHQTCIDNDIPTIAILPCGIQNITPKSNIKLARDIVSHGGLLLSAYPNKRRVQVPHYYHDRNELIAKFGSILIVPEFEEKSGSRNTVDKARDFHKPIFVQGGTKYSGNQYIIKNKNYLTFVK